MRALFIRCAALGLGTALCLAGLEVTLRAFPRLLPLSYRFTLPLHGIELVHPGILERTPVDAVPLPYYQLAGSAYEGSPPQDLQALGLVGADRNPDRERFGTIALRNDAHGLPNESVLEAADVVLVGDSFAVSAAVLSPAGLQRRLAQATGLSVYNLGVPAIGPQRELFVLREIGLAMRPRAVIWLFFGGNDVQEAGRVASHLENDVETYADLFSGYVRPRSLVFDLLRWGLREWSPGAGSPGARHPQQGEPVPPFTFHSREGPVPLWFAPEYLRNLIRTEAEWMADPGWQEVERVLGEIAKLRGLGAATLLVYVPSKPEVYLRHVDKDEALFHRMASWDLPAPLEGPPEELWRSAIAQGGNLDHVLATAAAAQGIDYLSLTPVLDAAAAKGILAFLQADTHWAPDGQQVAAEPLVAWLEGAL